MNSLKNLFIIAVLAAVAYGVYVSMSQDTRSTPPAGVADGWGDPINVEIPGSGSALPFDASSGIGTGLSGSPGGDAGGLAPPFSVTGPAESAASPTPPKTSGSLHAHTGMSDPDSSPPGPSEQFAGAGVGENSTEIRISDQNSEQASVQQQASSPAGRPDEVRPEFTAFLDTARAKLEQGQLEEVHRVLSSWYGDPRLTAAESVQLTDLLDQIAGTVIYSRAPNEFAQSYVVRPGDTLETIADSCDIPWQLLAKINGVQDPRELQPGQALKTVPGPFDAVIDLDQQEMTLMVQGHYAGRFPVGLGQDRQDLEGTYQVGDKVVNPTYYGRDRVIDADDPRNPLGERWIGLGDQVGIHGTNNPQSIGGTQSNGSICLRDRDVEDVFDILSSKSRVVIRR